MGFNALKNMFLKPGELCCKQFAQASLFNAMTSLPLPSDIQKFPTYKVITPQNSGLQMQILHPKHPSIS